MDIKFVKAIAIAYGNYRSALSRYGEGGADSALLEIISSAKALMALQEALSFDMVSREDLEGAIADARADYEAS